MRCLKWGEHQISCPVGTTENSPATHFRKRIDPRCGFGICPTPSSDRSSTWISDKQGFFGLHIASE